MTDDLIPKPEQCGASARIQIGPMPYIGPCILRHGHDGPVHQDAAGAQWTDPRPATAEDSAGLCPASLRDQIAEALPCPVCPAQAGEPCVRAREDNQQPHMSRRLRADAVMPVVEAALAALRASLDRAHTMAADRPDWRPAYDRLARALTDARTRADRAERERDEYRERFTNQTTSSELVERLGQAEAALQQARNLAGQIQRDLTQVDETANPEYVWYGYVTFEDVRALVTAVLDQPNGAQIDAGSADTWTVAVQVPIGLSVEMRHALFSAVAAAVSGWEPDDRDGWDADVSGYPTAAGYEMGCLDAALAAGPARHEVTIHSANATQADLIAMRRGYRCTFDPTDLPDWTHTTFTPQRQE